MLELERGRPLAAEPADADADGDAPRRPRAALGVVNHAAALALARRVIGDGHALRAAEMIELRAAADWELVHYEHGAAIAAGEAPLVDLSPRR